MKTYKTKQFIADQELEDVLNQQADNGYDVFRMFRNQTSHSGIETTTIVFKIRADYGKDKETNLDRYLRKAGEDYRKEAGSERLSAMWKDGGERELSREPYNPSFCGSQTCFEPNQHQDSMLS